MLCVDTYERTNTLFGKETNNLRYIKEGPTVGNGDGDMESYNLFLTGYVYYSDGTMVEGGKLLSSQLIGSPVQ